MVQNNKQRFLAPSTVRSSVRTSHILRWWCACIIRLQQNKQQRAMAKSWWANAKAQKARPCVVRCMLSTKPPTTKRLPDLLLLLLRGCLLPYLLALGRNCKQTVLYLLIRIGRRERRNRSRSKIGCVAYLLCERNSVIISKFPLNHLHWSTVFEFYYLNNRVLLSE